MKNTEAAIKAEILNSLQGWGYLEIKATLGKKAAEIVEEHFRIKDTPCLDTNEEDEEGTIAVNVEDLRAAFETTTSAEEE